LPRQVGDPLLVVAACRVQFPEAVARGGQLLLQPVVVEAMLREGGLDAAQVGIGAQEA